MCSSNNPVSIQQSSSTHVCKAFNTAIFSAVIKFHPTFVRSIHAISNTIIDISFSDTSTITDTTIRILTTSRLAIKLFRDYKNMKQDAARVVKWRKLQINMFPLKAAFMNALTLCH